VYSLDLCTKDQNNRVGRKYFQKSIRNPNIESKGCQWYHVSVIVKWWLWHCILNPFLAQSSNMQIEISWDKKWAIYRCVDTMFLWVEGHGLVKRSIVARKSNGFNLRVLHHQGPGPKITVQFIKHAKWLIFFYW
jgi:hypothetical protein